MDIEREKQNALDRLRFLRLMAVRLFYCAAVFAHKYPPFKYYFYTLQYFQVEAVYKRLLKEKQKNSTSRITRKIKKKTWEQSEIVFLKEELEQIAVGVSKIGKRIDRAEKSMMR
mgnify:CR=1 FL=1